MSDRISSERGLVGKALVVLLIFVAVAVVAVIDGSAIFFAKLSVEDTAQQASFDAAQTFKDTRDVQESERAASATATAKGAKLVHFEINKQTGEVTVTLAKKASTIVVQRFSFSRPWGLIKVMDTAEAPP
jgi:Flp pilus assembly protein TadG